jgi:ABC-2 type transport system permease protein
MELTRTAAIVLRQFYLMRSSPARVLPLFGWVAIDIILWGFITRYLNSVSGAGMNFVPTLLGAVLFWDFFTRVTQGLTTAFFEDVWTRNFLNIFASPLSISEYLAGLVVSSIATSTLGLVMMLVLAIGFFGLSYAIYGLTVISYLLVLFLSGISLGIFGTAMVLRWGPAAEWFIWPLPALISPFAGVFYPLATLPAWMQYLAHLVPASYVFENMRSLAVGRSVSPTGLLYGASIAAVYILLAAWFFTRIYKHAVRSGLIARYSAESLS